MGLFSFLRKNRQESASRDSAFYSHAEEDKKTTRSRGKRNAAAEDPALPEKKRARRRLIGALALVLAAVIGLPMLLDSQPQPVADDIVIQIPSKDKPSPSSVARPALPAADPESATDNEETAKPVSEPAPDAAVHPSSPVHEEPVGKRAEEGASTLPVPVKPSHPETRQPEPKAAGKTPAQTGKEMDAARAMAILEGKADGKQAIDKHAAQADERFVVQVAALASKAKIGELRSKLKQAGIQSYTQDVATASGKRTRIRVGPFSSHEEAEKMRARILKLGLSGAIVPGGR